MPNSAPQDSLAAGTALLAALTETWGSLREVCAGLTSEEWLAPTECPGWSVHDNLAHIVAIEQMLEGEPIPTVDLPDGLDHVKNDFGRINEMWVTHYRSLSDREMLEAFDRIVKIRTSRLGSLDAAGFEAESWTPSGPGTILSLLPFRIFDAWCHEQDVRIAVDHPGGWDTAASKLAVERMLKSLPYVVGKRAGVGEGIIVSVTLHGPHATSRTITVSEGRAGFIIPSEQVDVALAMATPDFMRWSLGRRSWNPDDGAVAIEGDSAVAHAVLSNLNVLF